MSKLFEMIREDIYYIKVLDRELLEYPLFECSMGSFEGMKGLGTEKHLKSLFKSVGALIAGEDEYRIFDKMCFIYDETINDYAVEYKNNVEHIKRKESCVFIDFTRNYTAIITLNDIDVVKNNIFYGTEEYINITTIENFKSLNHELGLKHHVYLNKKKSFLDAGNIDGWREWGTNDACWHFGSTAFMIDQINNSRDVFIMEESVAGRRFKPKNKNKYENKTKYRIIKPVDFVRKYLKRDDVEGTKKCDHFRRGHWRTFKSDRYKNVQGDRTWIDAVWIGESEATMKNVRYKIRLDL